MDFIYLFIDSVIIIMMIYFLFVACLFILNMIYELLLACVSLFRTKETKKDKCTICLGEVNSVPLACGHVFHK